MKTSLTVNNQTKKVTIAFAMAFLLFVVLTIGISTAFFSNSKTSQGQITLGELDFCISATQTQNTTVMPNMFVGQAVSVSNSRNPDGSNYRNLCNILFKFSIFVTIDGQIDYDIAEQLDFYIDSTKFIQSGNEFYYVGFLTAGQSQVVYSDIFLDGTIGNLYQGKEINFIISVDAIQAENGAYLALWQDAPAEWIEQIGAILQ